jgi:hypothetical protein
MDDHKNGRGYKDQMRPLWADRYDGSCGLFKGREKDPSGGYDKE